MTEPNLTFDATAASTANVSWMAAELAAHPRGPGVSVVVGHSLKTSFGYRQTVDWARAVARLAPPRAARGVELFVLSSFAALPAVAETVADTRIAVAAQDPSADGLRRPQEVSR